MANPRPSYARSTAGVCQPYLLALAGLTACGRIGYDLLDVPPRPDSGTGARPDALAPDSGETSAADAAPDEGLLEASFADAPEGLADAPPEARCPGPVVDYCLSIPSLPAPPVIDGVLECGPPLVPMPPVDWIGPAPLPSFPPGNSASLAAAWRPDGLYVFVAVTTPAAFPADYASPVFYGAGVELFVDDDGSYAAPPAYDNPGSIQLIAVAPFDSITPSHRGEGYRNAVDQGPWTPSRFGTFPAATGFVFEGFVAAPDMGLSTWTLQASKVIGFDIAVDVSYATAAMTGAQGHRVGQYFLHVAMPPVQPPYADPRSFCTPTLGP